VIAQRDLAVRSHDDHAIAADADDRGGADAGSLLGIVCRVGTVL
jgi:hypothetical protein